MEVMNSTEFEQKDVLVGGSGRTGKFTVNDDPHLMSMLSTSLYGNPLRTMIQEIMFNAWDAHRMGNCQDKPIDVYLNQTTGLIVRDYGPGIDPSMIDEIYCTYGASTKRNDSEQTGGFGLGSKSPYAYNDSFMVSNHFEGKKTMYIMRRIHDENDGGPGYDIVVDNVPTEECGLMVTVPMKSEHDRRLAYKYIKEILFLSGIKVNITFEGSDDEAPEYVEAESLAPGEFINSDMEESGIYAVYGGVKYEIPEKDEYIEEYQFLHRLTLQLGALYVGFKPNSLTPLPNREGLNMRERSIESIKETVEMIQEHFMSHIIPATKVVMDETLKAAKAGQIQPQYIAYKWERIGDRMNMSEMVYRDYPIITSCLDRRPDAMNASIWTSIVKLSLKNSRYIAELVGYTKFWNLKGLFWAKNFPELKHWRWNIMDQSKKNSTIQMEDRKTYAEWLISLQKKVEGITNGDNKPRVKIERHNQWCILTNQRRAGKFDHLTGRKKDIVQTLARTKKLKIPEKFYDDQLWFQKDGNPFNHTMMHNTIIVAKTAAALTETRFKFQQAFCPKNPETYGYDTMNWQTWVHNESVQPIAAFVVHKKKGQYDEVVQMLQDEGYHVIEADEPQPKAKVVASLQDVTIGKPEIVVQPGYPIVNYRRSDWEGEERVIKPSTYLYCTKTKLNSYDKPYDESLVHAVMQYAPKMAMVYNKKIAEKLSKQGVLSFEERVEEIVERLLSDKERIRTMRLHHFMHEESSLPKQILRIAEVQKIFGVPYLRTAQIEKFERDREFLKRFTQRRRYYGHYEPLGITPALKSKVQAAMNVADDDDSVVLARKVAKASHCFDKNSLESLVAGMKRGEQKVFSQKMIRFLRTV